MQLSNIVLNTYDRSDLSKYISELLDLEVDTESEEYSLEINGIKLIFKEEEILEKDSEHTVLNFSLQSTQELENLLKKVQFYHYRLNTMSIHERVYEIPEIQGDEFSQYFEVKDPDERKWRFSARLQ